MTDRKPSERSLERARALFRRYSIQTWEVEQPHIASSYYLVPIETGPREVALALDDAEIRGQRAGYGAGRLDGDYY